jgi:RNA polymerase sigma factor (sigma-70 family)
MDTGLVIRAQQGDEAAFTAIGDAMYDRLRAVAYRILRDPYMAEDATQQALIGIWRKLPRLRDPARFEAWSYRFLVNACTDEARRTKRSLPRLTTSAEPIAPDQISTLHDRDEIEQAFRQLSVEQRAAIVLHHYLDLTLEDTAEALGVPIGTVNSRLSRGVAKLREALGADHPQALPTPQEVAR